MAKTSKEQIEEKRIREKEYFQMRAILLDIINSENTNNSDKISAINTIFKMDKEGIPLPKGR